MTAKKGVPHVRVSAEDGLVRFEFGHVVPGKDGAEPSWKADADHVVGVDEADAVAAAIPNASGEARAQASNATRAAAEAEDDGD